MAEFFGDLERLAADLYPWRYLIGAAFLVVIGAIVAVGYLRGWHLWLWRYRIPVAVVGTPMLAVVAFLAYDLGSPLFTDVTVEDEFPFAFGATVPMDMDREDVEAIMATLAKVDQEVMKEPMHDMEAIVKSGDFRDQDAIHKGSGQATIYLGPDGTYLLRLENLDVTNGPDLHVILSAHEDPMNRSELKDTGYVDLGKLKGNKGNQNYPIADDVDVAIQNSVVIYCKPFHVIFSVAPLRDAG